MLKVKATASTESKFRCFNLKFLVKSMSRTVDVAVIGAGDAELIEGYAEFVSPHLDEVHS